MQANHIFITRRLFLNAVARCGGLALIAPRINGRRAADVQINKSDLEEFRAGLLQMVNTERAMSGVSRLALDELACVVADQHALDMASGKFLSHWGRDGRKAYHRYAAAGGFHATAENVAAADNVESITHKYLELVLTDLHAKMFSETAPYDGHRRTIIMPQHTHVGFGIALSERALRLVELYVAKYVELDSYQTEAKQKATVNIRGKLLNPKCTFRYAEVFYEPLPLPPDLTWLREPRSYGLPNEYVSLKPKLPDGVYYADGTTGVVDVERSGRFRVPVKLFKELPGIYTVVLWVSQSGSRSGFPVTSICIQAK